MDVLTRNSNRLPCLLFAASLTFILIFLPDPAWADSSIHIVISAIENEQTHARAKEVLLEAYRRIGVQAQFMDLPAQRALIWADEGITEGDAARIKGVENNYPNLIRVPTPVTTFQGIAFTKDVNDEIKNWNELKKYRIGIIRGIKYAEIGTKGMDPILAKDMTHLFTLLDNGRIQIAVAVKAAGELEIEKNFKGRGIHFIGSPLHSAPLFHLLNKKRRELLAPLNQVLLEMMEKGRIEAIRKKAHINLMEGN